MKSRIKAPWPDFNGNDIYQGDVIVHPTGECGVIVVHAERERPSDRWSVDYGDGVESRLCLQIGDRGQAIIR